MFVPGQNASWQGGNGAGSAGPRGEGGEPGGELGGETLRERPLVGAPHGALVAAEQIGQLSNHTREDGGNGPAAS